MLKGKFSEFAMKKDESVAEMFNRLNDIVNELKGLGFEVQDADFNHKFLRVLLERYDIIVTLLVRSNVKTATPTQILGKVLSHAVLKKSQDEAHGGTIDEKKAWLSKLKIAKLKEKVVVKKKNRMRRWLSLSRGSIK